eukprot:10013066-Alexandrium_andersonii.AAC.1
MRAHEGGAVRQFRFQMHSRELSSILRNKHSFSGITIAERTFASVRLMWHVIHYPGTFVGSRTSPLVSP